MTESGATAPARLREGAGPIRPAEWEERRAKLSQLLVGIAKHADFQMMGRCPYRNRLDQCTSSFGCRNKRKPEGRDELPCCVGDGGIDYRSAWEAEPDGHEPLRRAIRAPVGIDVPARQGLRGQS